MGELFAVGGEVDAFSAEDIATAVGDAYDIELQVLLAEKGGLLLMNLLNELCTHRTDTTNEDIQYLVFAEEEGVVQHIHGLAELLLWYDKRDVGFFCTLSKSNHADAVATQCAKEFACDTWHVLHLLAYDTHGSQSLLHEHRVHRAEFDFFSKLVSKCFHCCLAVFLLHTKGGGVLGGGLTYEEDRHARIG